MKDRNFIRQMPHDGSNDYRTKYEGFPSDHGMIFYSDGEHKLASWNAMGAPCKFIEAAQSFNNLLCVEETFKNYKERILGKEGLINYLIERLNEGGVEAAALQEADFLKITMDGIDSREWKAFRLECEKRFEDSGFETLKSDALTLTKKNVDVVKPQGRGCAILYKKDIYMPQEILSTIPMKQRYDSYASSDQDRVRAHLRNKKTGKSFHLVSVHLDYKISHKETGALPNATKNFAEGVLNSIGTEEPVFIMGDWNAPCPANDPNFVGTDVCTNPDYSKDSKSFAFTDPMFGDVEKGYDFVYVSKLAKATFMADSFIKGKDEAAIFIKNSCTKTIDLVPEPSCASFALLGLGLAIIGKSFMFFRRNPLFTLLGTAAGVALMWCSCKITPTLVPKTEPNYVKHSAALFKENSHSLVK